MPTASYQLDGNADVSAPIGSGLLKLMRMFQNVGVLGFFFESYQDNIVPFNGGGQASATPLTTELSRITLSVGTAAPYDSVLLPPSAAGMTLFIVNHSANPIQVFGTGSDQVDDTTSTTGVTQMGNSTVLYFCATAGNWYTEGLAGGFVRGLALQTFSSNTIAANATGTQASGTAVTTMMTNVSSAGANYSITLPASLVGMDITVHNVSTQTIVVFPNAGGTGTEKINALGANAGISMPTNTSAQFTCAALGQWYTVPRVPS
jgi:hypothetical protein